ncbi:MAG: endonuclease/exonuclease/phosphatase family protein [Kofleriaceae bacterium]|nr:endonuclease/exonuclease/phosphatase family protein [Kofleriaceae bacterium]
MKKLVLVLLAAGCTQQLDEGTPWQPVETMSGALLPEVGPAPPAPPAATCTLRIASWNVHFGEDTAGLARAISESTEIARADVLFVQEIEAYPGEPASRTEELARALGMTWVYAPAREEGSGTHGIATLSRFPITAAAVRELPYFDQPIRSRARNALATTIDLAGAPLQLVNVHLDVRLGPVDRVRQLHPAVNEVDERLVIGGDFNTNPYAWAASLVPLSETEAIVGQEQALVIDDYMRAKKFISGISADATTMRVPVLGMRTDNIYARALPIVGAGVELVDGSDHWPVWLDVRVCPEAAY